MEIVNVPGTTLFIIRGNPRDVQRVREVIREIEERSQLAVPRIVVQPLQNVDASTMSSVIERVFDDDSPLSSFYNAPLIVPLVRNNALLIIGSPSTVERTVEVVKAMDVRTEGVQPIKVFRLERASAEAAENVLEDLYDSGDSPPDLESLTPRAIIIADESSNSLIVRAAQQIIDEIGALIAEIDRVPDATVTVHPLSEVDASTMAQIIEQVFADDSPLGDFYPQPLTVPLVRPNSLLIIGTPSSVQRVIEVAKSMDQPAEGAQKIKVFRLKRASAEEAENVLEDLYDADDNAPDVESLLPRAVIIADASSNSLVVRASERILLEIGELIEQIDQVSDASALLKVFELRYGDAVGLVETLEALFGEADADDEGVFRLRFSVDERTNSVIAAGTSDELLVVETILLRLDTEDSRDRRNQVYKLKNANAEDVAIALQEYIQQKETFKKRRRK